jgi:hypothetical protein
LLYASAATYCTNKALRLARSAQKVITDAKGKIAAFQLDIAATIIADRSRSMRHLALRIARRRRWASNEQIRGGTRRVN